VYEYWLDKFLLPKLQQKFNSHKIIDEIEMHLKDNIGSVIKLKKLQSILLLMEETHLQKVPLNILIK